MHRKISWTERASYEFQNTLNYWNERNATFDYSNKIRNAVKEAEENLMQFPFLGRLLVNRRAKNVRRLIILRNYSLYYKLDDDNNITVLFFFDNRNNPAKLKF